MRLPIYCLMVQNGSLTDMTNDALVRAAQKLLREGGRNCRIKGPDFEGGVTTKHRSACFGGLAGVVFSATVELEQRTVKVHYLCPRVPDDIPLDELGTDPVFETTVDDQGVTVRWADDWVRKPDTDS